MRRERWILGILILVLAVLIVGKPEASLWLSRILYGIEEDASKEENAARLENQILKAELAVLYDIKARILTFTPEYLVASVYSRHYPFNFKNRILINIGSVNEVRPGQPVLFSGEKSFARGMLIGKVVEVFPNAASVETLFDPQWKSAVRIGKRGTEALLMGGNQPYLTLIERSDEIKDGEAVLTSSPDMPHGLPIGEVVNVRPREGKPFFEADLRVPYHINAIREVQLIKNFQGTNPAAAP